MVFSQYWHGHNFHHNRTIFCNASEFAIPEIISMNSTYKYTITAEPSSCKMNASTVCCTFLVRIVYFSGKWFHLLVSQSFFSNHIWHINYLPIIYYWIYGTRYHSNTHDHMGCGGGPIVWCLCAGKLLSLC